MNTNKNEQLSLQLILRDIKILGSKKIRVPPSTAEVLKNILIAAR
jgi:hypothetical protein